ncbi:FAD-dependent oxidoreductase [Micromonospora sagamiensis]|uniref:D-amino-acid oxidase n=1 Tax=Micromonospora sagamiensis TaxID=47875 RepID=A0A562WFK5_9ACTN|nr:FAD-dependent oxidoreductase [Micromonospora sagamiensis]TWJ29050.1 D-amino-acid:oxygen oxidoreductase (deaminating) [Micromonospora sagamiensis]BCL17925.1 amino acid oxidase [Micromonospora sagamiensis]
MTDVIVVGGGIIGLTTAVRLQERGARVTVLTAHAPEQLVSTVAAAVWYPTHTDPDPRVLAWATTTYQEFRRQAADGVPGVLLRRTRMFQRQAADELPWWAVAAGEVQAVGAPAPYHRELRFVAPLAEMATYLDWLRDRVVGGGGQVVRRRVERLDDLFAEAPVVVNATGLAAGALCGDPTVFPARGQVVLVANPGLDVSFRDEENPDGTTYVHPRSRDVVLGGTYESGRADLEPDPEVRAGILGRAVALVPELAAAPVVGERVGLRPARQGGPRVEAERRAGGLLVHAYGHAGAGMTLSWGSADEVCALVHAGR